MAVPNYSGGPHPRRVRSDQYATTVSLIREIHLIFRLDLMQFGLDKALNRALQDENPGAS
jgi:hypothetical protein